MFYKIAKLLIRSSKNTIKNSEVFIAKPDVEKEKLAGKLFIIIEIDSKSKKTEKIIDFLINQINNCYYQNEKILFREKLHSIKVEHIFEASLTKINKEFSSFLINERIDVDITKINVTAGIVENNRIHFANSGKNKILLVHKVTQKSNKIPSDKEVNYKISNISKQAGPDSQHNKSKIFSNVISGLVPKKGSFIISNEALPEYISNKQLVNISSTLPPISALEQMKQILTKTNSYIAFAAIIIKNTTQEEDKNTSTDIEHSAQESITTLNKTENTTETLLSPSGIINIKKYLKIPKVLQSQSKKQSQLVNYNLKDKIFTKKRQSFLRKTGLFFKNIFKLIFKTFFTILPLRTLSKNTSNVFKKLNLKRKILLLVFSTFLLLFVYNISSNKLEEIKIQKKTDYANLKNEIEQRRNKAEANLLYSNEEGAKNLFSEIEELIKDFPQNTKEQVEEFEKYKEILKKNLEKIQKITRIDDLDELANFKNLNSNASPDNIIFIASNNSIYASDSNQKAIYSLDTNNNSVTLAGNIEGQFDNLRSPSRTSDNSIYYFDNSRIVQYDTDNNNTDILSIDLAGKYVDSHSMTDVYNDRLYILNTAENNIHRHNRLANGFGSAYSWANKNIDLSDSVDISIDGHIYVLKKDGKLIRLLRGESTDWKLETIEPPLSSPNRLIVSSENDFIYILEKETNRIAVYDKEGQFIAQYTSNSFDNIQDFTVDEENRRIYVLNNSSIFAINITHLKKE